MFADFVDGANVGVIESRRSARLAPKALQRLRVLGRLIRQELKGDESAQVYVLCLVAHAHAPSAECFQDAVVRDDPADQYKAHVSRVDSSYGRGIRQSTNGSS